MEKLNNNNNGQFVTFEELIQRFIFFVLSKDQEEIELTLTYIKECMTDQFIYPMLIAYSQLNTYEDSKSEEKLKSECNKLLELLQNPNTERLFLYERLNFIHKKN